MLDCILLFYGHDPGNPSPLLHMHCCCCQADTLREMLEQIMDDEDELRELNLSSRPRREERRKQRERDRMERQLTRWGGPVSE